MAKRIEGKILAQEVLKSIRQDRDFPGWQKKTLVVVSIEPSLETVKFIERKRAVAEELGLGFSVETFSPTIPISTLTEQIRLRANSPEVMGIIVQLPLPLRLDVHQIFNAIPMSKDVDVLSDAAFQNFFFNNSEVIPPVSGAIAYICQKHKIKLKDKFVVVLGAGKLIGAPTLAWFAKQGAQVCSFCDSNTAICSMLQQADIVVSGTGNPHSITSEMLAKGAIVFDAGYTIIDGKAKGDVALEALEEKASLYTPVPGGIGPLTVAMIFKNALALYKQYK
jgi:methylenetetrahydrofolate dehydrogenase (NADP+)/methenyltetrahydrofolate cyclohydrolase